MSTAAAALLALVFVAGSVVALLLATNRTHLLPGLPGSPAPAPTPPLAGTVQRSAGGIYWGAYLLRAEVDPSVVTKFASEVGRRPAIVSIYQQWWHEPSFPAATARSLEAQGTVPLLAWEPWQPGFRKIDQPAYRLSVIAAGGFDAYVRRYADQVRAYGGPLFLEPFHEMNGDWYPWGGTVNGNTTADFVAAWRHLHDLFRREGATNATWTWTPNGETVPDTVANRPDHYWPGPEYVDWVGVDAYNWGAPSPTGWRTVAQTFSTNLTSLPAFGKPIVIAETACAERGGDKAAWITTLFATLTGTYRDVVGAVIWFEDSIPGYNWPTTSSPAAQASFAAAVKRPGVLSAGQVALSAVAR